MLPSLPSVSRLPARSLLASRRLLMAGLACSTVLLAACSRDQPQLEREDPAALMPPAVVSPGGSAPAAAVSGFTPLPTTNQVLAANPIGRSDPFASDRPAPSAPATRPQDQAVAPLQLPPGFLFSGVIRVGASPQAMVQLGDNTGSLAIGEVGGRNTDLLPTGWVVSAIDVDRGRLVLRQGGQTVTAEL
jgi:hypothetical protein